MWTVRPELPLALDDGSPTAERTRSLRTPDRQVNHLALVDLAAGLDYQDAMLLRTVDLMNQ